MHFWVPCLSTNMFKSKETYIFLTCFECLDEPVLLFREWDGLNVLAGDLSKLMTDWELLT